MQWMSFEFSSLSEDSQKNQYLFLNSFSNKREKYLKEL